MQQAMLMRIFATACIAGLIVAPDAMAQRRPRDQDEVFAARKSGQVMPLHQIEAKVVPKMAGSDYLGPEFDASSGVYRLKFMRGGSVFWLDVDGRTGSIIGRSGN
jgi:hypothetical protein